jgi:drug/metabolite transporter (DMT)-like permease
MYGKASLVQVLKLLEPFETLLLSQLLFQEGNACSMGIISSMMLVVGAAMSLLKLQSTTLVPQAVGFAILSGLTLSCRNVLQRKHHYHNSKTSQEWTKLEKSVVQFTQLSLYSGVWMGAIAILSYAMIRSYFVQPSIQVLLWHPLYNIFSMITLGFCSALTHSLLNAGKRVFAICMAMLWFREGLNLSTLAGLCLVGVGGSWYSWECKQPESSSTKKGREYNKVVLSISALVALLWFQSLGK